MDPNALLEELLTLAQVIRSDYEETDGNGVNQDDANELAEKIDQLDTWLCAGGFMPKRWERNT